MKRLTATELIAQLQAMIEAGEITPDAMVMLQGPGQNANKMGNLVFISPRIPIIGETPNGVILCSE